MTASQERRARERAQRRARILDAAEEVIAEVGLAATRMGQVADRAELSKGALYLYFENKDALCAALALRGADSLVARLDKAVAGTSGIDCVRAFLFAYRDHVLALPHHFRLMVSWHLTGIKNVESDAFRSFQERSEQVQALIHEVIADAQAQGAVRTDVAVPALAAELWAGAIGNLLMLLSAKSIQASHAVFSEEMLGGVYENYVDHICAGIAPIHAERAYVVTASGDAFAPKDDEAAE